MEKHYGNTLSFLGLKNNRLKYWSFKNRVLVVVVISLCLISSPLNSNNSNWGFYGHKLINKLAVYLLPDPMLPFFLKQINEISDHAIDPDKRRYASKYEGIRHYMDMEHWEEGMDTIPMTWRDMLYLNTEVYGVNGQDTILLNPKNETSSIVGEETLGNYRDSFNTFVKMWIEPNVFRGKKKLDENKIPLYLLNDKVHFDKYFWEIKLLEHGILPYNLLDYQKKLTRAFELKDFKRIMRYSADIGHYIGDAHVPLHTTANYNGQLTNQNGIHAFWETRIPELFAETSFDLFNQKAFYIEDPLSWYWSIVHDSHSLVDSVLDIEKRISEEMPRNKQYLMAKRNQTIQRTETEAYAQLYEMEMGKMVEYQMRKAILAIGCAWMTAWVDAGQPDLIAIEKNEVVNENRNIEPAIISKNVRGH